MLDGALNGAEPANLRERVSHKGTRGNYWDHQCVS
jgi:hypothetical protein